MVCHHLDGKAILHRKIVHEYHQQSLQGTIPIQYLIIQLICYAPLYRVYVLKIPLKACREEPVTAIDLYSFFQIRLSFKYILKIYY